MKSSFTLLLLFFLICSAASEAQDLKKARKSIYSVRRKINTELNRTKRDVRGVDKMLSSSKRTMDSSVDTADVITWEMKPYIPNSGMIHDYQYVYSFLHSTQEYTFQKAFDLKSFHWYSINNVF
jgi:hypothetical protein